MLFRANKALGSVSGNGIRELLLSANEATGVCPTGEGISIDGLHRFKRRHQEGWFGRRVPPSLQTTLRLNLRMLRCSTLHLRPLLKTLKRGEVVQCWQTGQKEIVTTDQLDVTRHFRSEA